MSATLIAGRALAAGIRDELRAYVSQCTARGLRPPGLAVILAGYDPASQIYVRNKTRMCEAIGIRPFTHQLPADITAEQLMQRVRECSGDERTDGVLVQLPLPPQLTQAGAEAQVIECIDPGKDVDGFHPYNVGCLAQRAPRLCACTPHGIMTMLRHIGCELLGRSCTVVSASNIVGRPLALELLLAGATVSVTHRFTPPEVLRRLVQEAEVLIVAVGRPGFLDGRLIREGAVVIDVGINRLPDGRLCGDVQFEEASRRAAYITPVPGGVGPMTVATLMQNTVAAYCSHLGAAAPAPAPVPVPAPAVQALTPA